MRRKWHLASEATSRLSVPPMIVSIIFVMIELWATESDEVGVLMGMGKNIWKSRFASSLHQPRGVSRDRANSEAEGRVAFTLAVFNY